MPRITPNKFHVDLAFGEEDDNSVVYKAVAQPLIDLAFQVVDRIFSLSLTSFCSGGCQHYLCLWPNRVWKNLHNIQHY